MKTQTNKKGDFTITPLYYICMVETKNIPRDLIDDLAVADRLVELLPFFNKRGYIVRAVK